MNIARILSGLLTLATLASLAPFTACATQRSEPSAAPAASPSSGTVTSAPVQAEEERPASPSPPSPPGLDRPKSESARDEEFTTLEAAERALNQAKADLDRLAMAEPAPALGHGAADSAEKKAAKRGAPSASGAGAPASSAPNGECEQACRAFASLTRAASAVCRLDGQSGMHCSRAKRVVSESERRVASCTCPG